MNNRTLVSVIIPSYNSAHYLVESVSSVLQQTYHHVEIIVINDGSTDNTVKVLEPYREKIQYIYQENRGVSVARNQGIAAAQGELIAFLDADDVWLPEKLELQVQCLEQHPGVGLVHADAFYLHHESGQKSKRSALHSVYEGKCYEPLFLYGNRIVVSSVVLRRECIRQIGTFDEAITRPTVEDYDLWLRVARSWEFAYLHEPLVLYRLHASNASKRTQLLRQNELYVLEKTLAMDPVFSQRVGRQAIKNRFFAIWFELGYLSFDQEHFREATRSFFLALQFRLSLYVLMLCLMTCLPSALIKNMRHLKRQVVLRN